VPFLLDSAASQSLTSVGLAQRILRKEALARRFNLPEKVWFEAADGTIFPCDYTIQLSVKAIFNDGEALWFKDLVLYAVQGFKNQEVLIGRSTLTALKIDLAQLVQSSLRSGTVDRVFQFVKEEEMMEEASSYRRVKKAVHPTPNKPPPHPDGVLLSPKQGSTRNIPTKPEFTKRLTQEEDSEEDELDFMEVALHDSETVKELVAKLLEDARAQGLSATAVAALEKEILREDGLLDVFRSVLGPDPPARVEPIQVQMRDSIYNLKKPPVRRYTPEGSKAIADWMAMLETFGYVRRNKFARIVSPAYPVKKHGIHAEMTPRQKYRLTVDLRAVNSCTVPIWFPLPRLETFASVIAGNKFFGTLDLFNGYWQLPLHPDSQEFFSILTDAGIWTPNRLIQGSRNAAGPFQAIVAEVLGEDLLNKGCILYIDDILVMGATEEMFVRNWLLVLTRLHSVGLKVSALKTRFYTKQAKYCGRIFTAEGASFDPALITSVTSMSPPTKASELRKYLATTNWLRPAVPKYAELVEPLQGYLTELLREDSSKSTKHCKANIDPSEWYSKYHDVFLRINSAIANSTTLAYWDPDQRTCVFTDASDTHWAGIVTQTKEEELLKPMAEQQHTPLAFVSGAFRGSQLNWPTIEKEGFAVYQTCERCEHLLYSHHGFSLFTDHRNLKFLFSLDDSLFSGRKQARDRVERWTVAMRRFNYSIEHIPGTLNVGADMLSRWAAPRIEGAAKMAKTRNMTRMETAAVQSAVTSEEESDNHSSECSACDSSDTSTQSESDSESDDTTSDASAVVSTDTARGRLENSSVAQHLLEFSPQDAPSLAVLKQAQAAVRVGPRSSKGRLLHIHHSDDELDGLWMDEDDKIFVPDTQRLRLRMFVIAHQGLGGHRGSDITLRSLRDKFCWEGMASDVETMCKACLHCQRAKGSGIQPRPWGQIPKASRPNEVIHFDYLYIRSSNSEEIPEYVLVIIDGFSRFVWLTAHKHANAENVVKALLQWFGLFGTVKRWVSDQGRHFLNSVLREMRNHLGVDHHFTATYAPWSNGLVERANKEVVTMLRTLVSEAKIERHDWARYLPIINSMINGTPSSVLGGKAPMTAFMAHEPVSPLNVVFSGITKTVVPVDTLNKSSVTSRVIKLQKALESIVSDVNDVPRRAPPKRRGAKIIDFDVGDFVLVAKPGNRNKDKTMSPWDGPALVVDTVSPKVFEVRHLLTGESRHYHVDFIKRYADKDLKVTTQLKNFVAASAIVTNVRDIFDHRFKDGKWELLVAWEGFEDDEVTWQDLEQLYEDVPEMVISYLKSVVNVEDQRSMHDVLRL